MFSNLLVRAHQTSKPLELHGQKMYVSPRARVFCKIKKKIITSLPLNLSRNKCHFYPSALKNFKRLIISIVRKDTGIQLSLMLCGQEECNWQKHFRNQFGSSHQSACTFFSSKPISRKAAYKNACTCAQTYMYKHFHCSTVKVKIWKQPNRPSEGNWLKKQMHAY